jgi:hypothetical protein
MIVVCQWTQRRQRPPGLEGEILPPLAEANAHLPTASALARQVPVYQAQRTATGTLFRDVLPSGSLDPSCFPLWPGLIAGEQVRPARGGPLPLPLRSSFNSLSDDLSCRAAMSRSLLRLLAQKELDLLEEALRRGFLLQGGSALQARQTGRQGYQPPSRAPLSLGP